MGDSRRRVVRRPRESSVYATVDSANGTNVVVVAINKTTTAKTKTAGITLKHTAISGADVYTLTSASATPKKGTAIVTVAPNAFSYAMPPMSVTTLVFHP